MELELTDAQQARLTKIAQQEGKSVADLLADAATSLIQLDEHRWASVDRALTQADRGEFIEEEEMDSRVASMLAQ